MADISDLDEAIELDSEKYNITIRLVGNVVYLDGLRSYFAQFKPVYDEDWSMQYPIENCSFTINNTDLGIEYRVRVLYSRDNIFRFVSSEKVLQTKPLGEYLIYQKI